jgi:phosphoserine phosphatase RsbX
VTDAPAAPQVLDWAHAGAALEGDRSGDVHVVAPFPHGAVAAVIDGLGHGHEAWEAADEAARVIARHAADPVNLLVERCHEALRRTRGAVMTVASFDVRAGAMTWVAVGNVEGVLLRDARRGAAGREVVTARGGIVGYQLPPLRSATLPVLPGDTLVLATDGIRSGFVADLDRSAGPRALAESILARHGRGSDDALVLVARYLGGTS